MTIYLGLDPGSISGAVGALDSKTLISVQVTGTKLGYQSVTQVSTANRVG